MLSLKNKVMTTVFASCVASTAIASSHREAPAISKDPFADNTDTYVFVPRNNTDNVVLAASWIPFEGPEGGPNYFEWDDTAQYKIHVDSDGDAIADWVYTLTSNTVLNNPNTFLYNTGAIASPADNTNWNRQQFITVQELDVNTGTVTNLINNLPTAPVNIGSKSTPNYPAIAAGAVRTIVSNGQTIRTFGGQTDDAFFVDLQVFDLLTLRGQAAPIGYSSGDNTPLDSLAGFNVHTLVIELPHARLRGPNDAVLGVWSTTERGAGNQVSRLGMPLVNEVVINLGIKDTFNTLRPNQDASAGVFPLLQPRVENPELGTLLCQLYQVPLPDDANGDCNSEFVAGTPRSARGDIFDIFLTGMTLATDFTIQTPTGPQVLNAGTDVNRPRNPNIGPGLATPSPLAGVVPAEMIRINVDIASNLALCSATPSPLGVLGGDACGFPNGRRLTDDVVDIEILAVAGAAYSALSNANAFTFNSALIPLLSDNVNENDVQLSSDFPYFATAQSGQEHVHTNPFVAAAVAFAGGSSGGGAMGVGLIALLGGLLIARRRRNGGHYAS